MDVFKELKEIIAAELSDVSRDKITMEARFKEDLKADSLDVVQIVMTVEDQFHLEIPEEALENIKTVGQAVEAIEKAMA